LKVTRTVGPPEISKSTHLRPTAAEPRVSTSAAEFAVGNPCPPAEFAVGNPYPHLELDFGGFSGELVVTG
jgi:hypothetical protein